MSAYALPDSFTYPPGGKILFQHAEGATVLESTLDLDDSPTVAWTLTDDPPNGRVKVAAVVQGITAAMVANAADKSSAAPQSFTAQIIAPLVEAVAPLGNICFEAAVTGEANARLLVTTENNVTIKLGPGAGTAPDTWLYRDGATTLRLFTPLAASVQLKMGNGTQAGLLQDAGGGLYIGYGPAGAAGGKLGFFGAAPIAQPGTASFSAAYVSLTGTTIKTGDTFAGWTIPGVVGALRALGILA